MQDRLPVEVVDRPEEVEAVHEIGFEYILQKDNLISQGPEMIGKPQ
jgi:hypothetical protein